MKLVGALSCTQTQPYQLSVTGLKRSCDNAAQCLLTPVALLADSRTLQVQHKLQLCQEQLQEQQSALSGRHAEVAALQSELQGCKTRMHMVSAAQHSAQMDYNVALARSDKLYTQELQHLQTLLQVSLPIHIDDCGVQGHLST